MLLAMRNSATTFSESKSTVNLELFRNLQDAVHLYSDCASSLMDCKLSRWLPINMYVLLSHNTTRSELTTPYRVTLTVLPLMLLTVDLQLKNVQLTELADTEAVDYAVGQHRLDVVVNMLNHLNDRYDGAEWVVTVVQRVTRLAEYSRTSNFTSDFPGWTEALTGSPRKYMHFALMVDFSLNGFSPRMAKYLPTRLRQRLQEVVLCKPMEIDRQSSSERDTAWEPSLGGLSPGYLLPNTPDLTTYHDDADNELLEDVQAQDGNALLHEFPSPSIMSALDLFAGQATPPYNDSPLIEDVINWD